MKKFLAVVFIVCFIGMAGAVVAAEIDLSGMSFEELVALRGQVDLALWATEEWQEVDVPEGVYEVGVDIPAGHWTITAGEATWPYVYWGTELDEIGRGIKDYDATLFYKLLMHPDHSAFKDYGKEYPPLVDLKLTENTYVVIEDGFVVFSPFTGKPALGFK